jgi:diguanylate cyclase (GGDEF)-like protein
MARRDLGTGGTVGIRGRTIAVISAIIVVQMAVFVVGISYTTGLTASRIESRDVADALARAEAVVTSEGRDCASASADWSQWTDTYNYVAGRMPSYPANNLTPSSISNLGVDLIAFIDARGNIVSVSELDEHEKLVATPRDLVAFLASKPALLSVRNSAETTSGLFVSSGGVYVLGASAITNDTASLPSDGVLVTGRRLGPQRIAQIQNTLLAPLSVRAAPSDPRAAGIDQASWSALTRGDMATTPTTNDRIMGSRLLHEAAGNGDILLSVTIPRVAMDFSAEAQTNSGIGYAIFGLVMIVAVGVAIEANVLRRLKLLSDGVRSIGPETHLAERIHIGGHDEIASVAESINTMLDALEESHTDLAYLASHDPLTRLYNRRRFEIALKRAIADTPGYGTLLWIDIDHFKDVNDSLGHAAGDELLAKFADVLAGSLRGDGTIARLGGDEFGVLIVGCRIEDGIGAANRLLEKLSATVFTVAKRDVRVSASIGIASFPDNGQAADDLLARSDLAMYRAKGMGRNTIAVFTSEDELQSEMAERIMMAEQILEALREDQFELWAQPVRSTRDEATPTYELLLRLVKPDGAVIMPNRIIPVAERIGLIRDIDRWVVKRGIRMLAEESAAGRQTCFAVNLSGTAFSDGDLLGLVRDEIERCGIDARRLIIEITETTAISDIQHAKDFIDEIKKLGCRFSLDDFGAGSSSFAYLKHLPIDYLKIDGALVKNLERDTVDEHFVRAIIEMCKGLGIPTVAEFVENDQLYRRVRELGVDFAQGYGIGHPLPPAEYLGDASTDALDALLEESAQESLDPDVT